MNHTYTFAATLKKHGLSTKKQQVVIGEGPKGKPEIDIAEVPCVTIILELIADRAREINAQLSAYQGDEVTVEIHGEGRQLNIV